MKEKKGFLLKTTKGMNIGTTVSAVGFLAYLAVSVVSPLAADIVAGIFSVAAVYVWISVVAGRHNDKEAVSYNRLWGQSAVTLMLVACTLLGLWSRIGG